MFFTKHLPGMGRKVNNSYDEFNQIYFMHPKGREKWKQITNQPPKSKKKHFELVLLLEVVVPVQVSTLKILLSSQRNQYRKMSTQINVSGVGKK